LIKPGEIYLADFPEAGKHPVFVISRESLNRGHYGLVAFCTSSRFDIRRTLPNCVPFRAGQFGFTKDCVAQCENILTIDHAQLDLAEGPVGVLDDVSMRAVIQAIGYVIGSDCEPV
jgi:mRNA-degrading endonuclease toxin of MazEF toxin-antitoxin module